MKHYLIHLSFSVSLSPLCTCFSEVGGNCRTQMKPIQTQGVHLKRTITLCNVKINPKHFNLTKCLVYLHYIDNIELHIGAKLEGHSSTDICVFPSFYTPMSTHK